MLKWLKKLAGGGVSTATPGSEPVSYRGFDIYPEPRQEGGQFRLQGRIVQHKDGEQREYLLIRSDLLPSAEQAAELMIGKAKRVIDENGERLFD
ncbi:transcriptional regulator [Zobellella endophytica]|uniref:Transcriptional regulator n=1 Tax=Zobellella endophytica TaxID=2116700 RepID=A0A2P7R3F9_9GAMM|nr:HlyU family transcriptional regulator [Zobellella endophytica]PSJ44726.1 transcriptional regulator [Zobellella endophytica]